MSSFICVYVSSAMLALFPLRTDEDPSKADRAMLQGTWELNDPAGKRTLEIKEDTFIFRFDGKITRQVTATLHATKKLKAIDLKEDGEEMPFLAIYKIEKERLTLCIAVEEARPTSTRPTAFEAKPGQTVATYTKAK